MPWPVYKLDFYKFVLPLESLVTRLKFCKFDLDCNFNEFLNKLRSLSFKYFHSFKSFKIFSSVFNKNDVMLLKKLSSDKTVIVCKPDKGRGVVLLDKDMYLSKMNELISDASKFEKLCDPVDRYTVRMEDKVNRLLRKLKYCDAISDVVYKSLYVSGASPGILYGLPKIHKPDFSSKFQFRPIFFQL